MRILDEPDDVTIEIEEGCDLDPFSHLFHRFVQRVPLVAKQGDGSNNVLHPQ